MGYSPIGAIGGGMLAAVVTALFLYAVLVVLPQGGKLDALKYLGLDLAPSGPGWLTYALGATFMLVLGALFGLVHAALYHLFEVETDIIVWGALFGLAQWLLDGALLGWLGRRHPAVRAERIRDPGAYVLKMPLSAVVTFLGIHILFGMFAGAFYDAFR
ncbi:MAG: hypothetical protein HY261_09015 [Chloroflexi bacterium]|nr:hypothetical protein [Chloroflexota bacterium]